MGILSAPGRAWRAVLGVLNLAPRKVGSPVDRLFLEARSKWHPTPPHQEEKFLALTDRCKEIEAELVKNGPPCLCDEFFNEAVELNLYTATAVSPAPKTAIASTSLPEEESILNQLIIVIQLMEDVWLSADLEHYWSHPLNEGWMSYFHRWAATPSFRRWWPVLCPAFSPGFRKFAQARFNLALAGPKQAQRHTPRLDLVQIDWKLFWKSPLWREFKNLCLDPKLCNEKKLAPLYKQGFSSQLRLLDHKGQFDVQRIQVGFLLWRETSDGMVWNAEHLFVPPRLRGAGFLTRFLDDIIANRGYKKLRVIFSGTKEKALDSAARYDRVRTIEFYKSRGFQYFMPEDDDGSMTLVRSISLPG